MSAIETAIVIPFRNEPYLPTMMQNLFETADCPFHVYLVSDHSATEQPDVSWINWNADPLGGVPQYAGNITLLHSHARGLSYARHVGLAAARDAGHTVAVLLDAHMSFVPGSAWLSRMTVHARNNPRTFFSAASVRCSAENMDPVYHLAHGRYECGADMVPRQLRGADRPIPEFFARKWRGDRDLKKTHTVACPLGGAYGLSLAWYFDELRAPWQHHIGWGASEQLVAVGTWYRGGKCESIGVPIGHMYRHVPTVSTRWWKVVYNNLLLLELYVPETVGCRYYAWAESWRPNDVRRATEEIEKRGDKILELRKHFDPDEHFHTLGDRCTIRETKPGHRANWSQWMEAGQPEL